MTDAFALNCTCAPTWALVGPLTLTLTVGHGQVVLALETITCACVGDVTDPPADRVPVAPIVSVWPRSEAP